MTRPRPPRPRLAFRPTVAAMLEPRIVASGAGGAAVALRSTSMRPLRDVVYRDQPGDRQALDVLIPAGQSPPGGWPVVVAIHGGGWRRYSKEQYEPTVAPLVARGFVVVAPNYRLSRPGAPSWPTNFEDVRDAVRWVRGHASEINANPGRIAAMGESAGGHLAALLGTYPDGPVNPDGPPTGVADPGAASARVQAVVDFYGPTDLARLSATSRGAAGPIGQMLGAAPAVAPDRAAAASPVSFVSADDPPFLIVQGAADGLVKPQQSADLAARLRASGVPTALVRIPGEGHGFGLRAGGRDLAATIARFLTGAMPAPV